MGEGRTAGRVMVRGNHSRNRTVHNFMEVVRQGLFCRLSPIVFVTKKKHSEKMLVFSSHR